MKEEPFVPVAGCRYRLNMWSANTWVEVLGVGAERFFGINQVGEEGAYLIDDPRSEWIEVILPDPIPAQYINVYDVDVCETVEEADRLAEAAGRKRLARIHTHTDNTGVDRVYLDRV